MAIYEPVPDNVEDIIRMSVWDPDPQDDPSEGDITPNQIMVGLRIDATYDDDQWAKEIEGWKACECGVPGYKLHQDHSTVGYQWMLVEKGTVGSLVFNKKMWLEMWNAYSFNPIDFWNLLGGHIIAFDWLFDGGFEL